MLDGELERVDDAENLIEVTAGRCRVGDDSLHTLVGTNEVDGTDGEGHASSRDVGLVNHAILEGNCVVLISNDGVPNLGLIDLFDVLDPSTVALRRVNREGCDDDATALPLALETSNNTKLGGANRGEVTRVGEEDCPLALNILVPLDFALGRVCLKVRC